MNTYSMNRSSINMPSMIALAMITLAISVRKSLCRLAGQSLSCSGRLRLVPAGPVRTALVLCSLALASNAVAAEPVSKSRLSGVAIGGHDSAAYHTLETEPRASAVPGVKSHVVEYKGATWRFASAESAARFAADPDRYSPVYNGHCANALSLGEGLVRTDGTHWEIFGDELFLFYAARGRERWLGGDWEAYRQEADAAWQALSD